MDRDKLTLILFLVLVCCIMGLVRYIDGGSFWAGFILPPLAFITAGGLIWLITFIADKLGR